MYTLSFPVEGKWDFREVGLTLDRLCMSAPEYLSDCDNKAKYGEICNTYLCADSPSSLWVEKELMTFAKLFSACCIALKTKLTGLPPPSSRWLTICRSQDCTGAAVGFAFKKG